MKRKKKVLKLKKGVRSIIIVVILQTILFGVLTLYTARVNAINSNQEGYTESGHAHSVQVNFEK